MGPTDFLVHLANFLAPAAALAILLPLLSRLLLRRAAGLRLPVQAMLVFGIGAAALAAGLWGFGRDGKMLTYAGLVVACASAQWLASRAWR